MAKIARTTNLTNSTLTQRRGQEGLREVRKFRKNRKIDKNFSCYVKRLSNKYDKNSKNNKFNKILWLGPDKGSCWQLEWLLIIIIKRFRVTYSQEVNQRRDNRLRKQGLEDHLHSSQGQATPQDSINEFIIRRWNPLLVVDFRFISVYLQAF